MNRTRTFPSGLIVQTYSITEAVAYFRAKGDAQPDVYLFHEQWANANDGDAVWSAEFADGGQGAAEQAEYNGIVRGDDLWWDDRSYMNYQLGIDG